MVDRMQMKRNPAEQPRERWTSRRLEVHYVDELRGGKPGVAWPVLILGEVL